MVYGAAFLQLLEFRISNTPAADGQSIKGPDKLSKTDENGPDATVNVRTQEANSARVNRPDENRPDKGQSKPAVARRSPVRLSSPVRPCKPV